MPKVSVLTLTRNRTAQLKNLLEGLARSSRLPDECVVVHMNEAITPLGEWPFPCAQYRCDSTETKLPLPKARNYAASQSSGDILLFLDVDCIPAREMVAAYERACCQVPDNITMGNVQYLREGWSVDWQADDPQGELQRQSAPHPKRDISRMKTLQVEESYGLFWSLSFALFRKTFERLGGFSPYYPSYGAEDTDFAWKARGEGVTLHWVPDAVAFHQYHPSPVPPRHNFDSIVHNAKVFYKRWGEWPMESWLQVFADEGLIDWSIAGEDLKVLRSPVAS